MEQRFRALDRAGPRDGLEQRGCHHVERRGATSTRMCGIWRRRGIEQERVARLPREVRMCVVRRHPRIEPRDALLHRIRRVDQRVIFAERRKPE